MFDGQREQFMAAQSAFRDVKQTHLANVADNARKAYSAQASRCRIGVRDRVDPGNTEHPQVCAARSDRRRAADRQEPRRHPGLS